MSDKPSLNDVYCKFGEVSEAVQLLETELGNLLLFSKAIEERLFVRKDRDVAKQILDKVNKSTLGQLLLQLRGNNEGLDKLNDILTIAKFERNRLIHSFYRQHNLRRNSVTGRLLMMQDLELIHDKVIMAYKEVSKLSVGYTDKVKLEELPTDYLPI